MNWSALPARSLAVVLVLLVVGLTSGRPEAVALATPLLVGPALAFRRSSGGLPTASLAMDSTEVNEAQTVTATVTIRASENLEVVRVALRAEGFAVSAGALTWTTALRAGDEEQVEVVLEALRWGRRSVGPVTISARASGLLGDIPEVTAPAVGVLVFPAAEGFRASSAAPHALAYAGEHLSRAVGPGIEFAGVRPLQTGDRLRRINWRATLRSGDIHVTASLTDRSALVLLLIDSSHDAGPAGSSTLDVSVRVAAAVAEHYLGIGDSLGAVEYGGRRRVLLAGTGQVQLGRVRHWLLDVRPAAPGSLGSVVRSLSRLRASRALVIAVSPLLDEEASVQIAALHRQGASIAVIDVLTEATLPRDRDEVAGLAKRLWLLERRLYVDRLGDVGIPVVRWAGEGSLDRVLGDLARVAAAPRMGPR